jgi:hypothetical protein
LLLLSGLGTLQILIRIVKEPVLVHYLPRDSHHLLLFALFILPWCRFRRYLLYRFPLLPALEDLLLQLLTMCPIIMLSMLPVAPTSRLLHPRLLHADLRLRKPVFFETAALQAFGVGSRFGIPVDGSVGLLNPAAQAAFLSSTKLRLRLVCQITGQFHSFTSMYPRGTHLRRLVPVMPSFALRQRCL